MIKIQDLLFSYKSNEKFSFPDVEKRTFRPLLVLGRSGCGKTTFLHLVAGLLKANSGKIEIEGTDITKLTGKELDLFRGRNIGVIFQSAHFVKALSVIENLRLPSYLAKSKFDEAAAVKLLQNLNLGDKIRAKTHKLSQGEKQRLAIARAIINNPKIILADEPTASLDDDNCFNVVDLLKEQAEQKDAHLIIVTHDNRLKEVFEDQIILNKP